MSPVHASSGDGGASARPWRRRAAVALGLGWLAVISLTWSVMAQIEERALYRPLRPVGAFTTALGVKGRTHYVTPGEARWDHIAHWVFFAALASFALAAVGYEFRKRWRA